MPEPTDAALIEAARAGERRALASLIERHQGRVYRFALKMCGNPDDAQDVLQETLLSLAKGLDDYRGEASLPTWLYTVARSHCIKKRRRSKFAPSSIASLHEEDGAKPAADARTDPEEATAAREMDDALQFAIDGLDQASREVLVLRDVEGLTAPEVASVLGTSPAAVKSRLHRARVAVRDAIAPLLQPPPVPSGGKASCPDVLSMFSRYLEGEISSERCAELEAHLQRCPRCEGACASLRKSLLLCGTAGKAVAVPSAVQASVKVALRDFLAEA